MRHLEKRLGLERSRSCLEAKIEDLGLVSVSGKSGKVSSRSRLEQTFKRLGLERKGLVYMPGLTTVSHSGRFSVS